MHRFLKWATLLLAVVAALLLAGVGSLFVRFPDAGPVPQLQVAGTPEQVALHPDSHTGRFLRELIEPTPA